jgi:hypothetical protein
MHPQSEYCNASVLALFLEGLELRAETRIGRGTEFQEISIVSVPL